MISKDRKLAFFALRDIEERSSWSNLALNSHIEKGGADDPAFVRELVYGVLRNTLLLDSSIDTFLSRPKIGRPERLLLRMGFYQIALMGGVADHAAVHETVELAKHYAKGREGLINAVLRSFIRRGSGLIVPEGDRGEIEFSCRRWIAELWREAYGEEAAYALMAECQKPAELALRVNTLRIGRAALASRLSGTREDSFTDTALLAGGGALLDSEAYRQGLFSVQSRMSQFAVQLLDPQPGETIIDLCAAPGGKSCCIAERMQNRGLVLAFDLYEKRVGLIQREAERLGIGIIKAAQHDAQLPIEALSCAADRVLCDVPCSGLGTIRRKPEIKLREKPAEFRALPELQLHILMNGAGLVKPGGKVLYSTCTINPAENEYVIRDFLKDHHGFRSVYERQFFPQDAGDGFYLCLMEKEY